MKRIYLDHAATTPVDPRVVEAMTPYFSQKYGNASSLHEWGREAREAIERARKEIAKRMKVFPEEIYFTSGGTESDNAIIKGIAWANKDKGKHIITSKIEHHAVLNPCEWLEKQGFEVTYLPVDEYGVVDLDALQDAIKKDTILISVMAANNEIGTIQPLKEISEIARDKGVYFHSDAVQAYGKIPVDYTSLDAASVSSHKIYGPKGVGLMYVKQGTKIEVFMHGGGHERGRRSGTENVPGIVGLAKATELAFDHMKENAEHEEKLRKKLVEEVLGIPNSWLNGHPEKRLPGNAHFGFDFIEGESLLLLLDQKGIAASTGSACSTGDLRPSHVLLALGLPHEKCHGSLRLTIGRENTMQEIEYTAEAVREAVEKLRAISPYGK